MPNHWHLVLWPRRDGELSEYRPPAASPAWPPFARSATKAKENWSAPPRRSSWPSRPVAQSGKLWLPRSAKWIKAYVDELVRFTGRDDREDDQVDMSAYAAWQVRQVFNDADPPLIEVRPNDGSHAAELGMWGR